MKRGMTLLEMLLALALLSALAVAAAGLTGLAGARAAVGSERERWRSAALAALEVIDTDLAHWDIAAEPAPERVIAGRSLLTIRTRAAAAGKTPGGAVVHEYRVDPTRGVLVRAERDGRSGDRGVFRGGRSRDLVGPVLAWTAAIDSKAGTLSVRISGPDGQEASRRYRIR